MTIDEELTRFEELIKKLKFEYEQYFIGESKLPPEKLQKDVEALIRNLYAQPLGRAGPKFRFQMLIARYNTYKSYWEKIMRDILEGITPRDRIRSKLKTLEPTEKAEEKAPEGDPMRRVYKQYIQAKKDQGEEVSNLTFDKLAETLKKQAKSIKEKYKCTDVEFKVAVEGGKVKLKAVPK